jgi:hypothetical protein
MSEPLSHIHIIKTHDPKLSPISLPTTTPFEYVLLTAGCIYEQTRSNNDYTS